MMVHSMLMMVVVVVVVAVVDDAVPDIIVQVIEAFFRNGQQDEGSRYTWAIVYTTCKNIEYRFLFLLQVPGSHFLVPLSNWMHSRDLE